MTAARTSLRVRASLTDDEWRRFLSVSPDANIFHTPEMFRLFDATVRHQPELWAVENDREVVALFTPVEVTVIGGPAAYLSTRSVAYGGFATTGADRAESVEVLLEHYRHHVGPRPVFTECRNQVSTREFDPLLARQGWRHEPHLNILLDLNRATDEIWSGLKSNARGHVRKATKAQVAVDPVGSGGDLIDAYDVLRTTYQRLRVPLPPLAFFKSAFEILHPLGMLEILLARTADGTVIGALCLLMHKAVATYWYTGALREYSRLRANDLMVWRAVELAVERGARTFDFGGAGKPTEDYGVRDFKLKFGGEVVDFGRHVLVHSPSRKKLSEAGYELIRRFL